MYAFDTCVAFTCLTPTIGFWYLIAFAILSPGLIFFSMEILFYIHTEAISAASDSDSIALRSHELRNIVTREMIVHCDIMWLRTVDLLC